MNTQPLPKTPLPRYPLPPLPPPTLIPAGAPPSATSVQSPCNLRAISVRPTSAHSHTPLPHTFHSPLALLHTVQSPAAPSPPPPPIARPVQVPLMLQMGEERQALAKAAAHGDTELIYLLLIHLKVRRLPTKQGGSLEGSVGEGGGGSSTCYCFIPWWDATIKPRGGKSGGGWGGGGMATGHPHSTEHKPNRDHIGTRSRPDRDHIATRSRLDWNRHGIRSGPDWVQIRTRCGLDWEDI